MKGLVIFLIFIQLSIATKNLGVGGVVELERLPVRQDTITVSGFSSGGCFATQFHFAFSNSLVGMASFAGGPYLSAYLGTSVPVLVEEAKKMAGDGRIDSLEGLEGDNIYIFQGMLDFITPWEQADRIKEVYEATAIEPRITMKNDLFAEHGFPSEVYGTACYSVNWENYIINCKYSGAQIMAQLFYGGNVTVPDADVESLEDGVGADVDPLEAKDGAGESGNTQDSVRFGNLQEFDQAEFFNGNPDEVSMDTIGYMYIPESCRDDISVCHLHFHFHGCGMGRHFLGDSFIVHSSFLVAAELYKMVVVFPQVVPLESPVNENGCWNWWGYLNDTHAMEYGTKSAAQMAGIARMMEKIAGIDMF